MTGDCEAEPDAAVHVRGVGHVNVYGDETLAVARQMLNYYETGNLEGDGDGE